jgi:hypothetical protein
VGHPALVKGGQKKAVGLIDVCVRTNFRSGGMRSYGTMMGVKRQ